MPMLSNPRREAFAQAYARGPSAGRPGASYLAAGYKSGPVSASKSGWRLMNDPRVRRRIAELQRDCAARPASPDSPFIARGDPMPFLSNPKHEAFAQAFVSGETAGSRRLSYLAAGYACDGKSAKEGAWRLMKNPRVMRRIAELQQKLQETETRATERAIVRLAITKEAVLAELAKVAFANMLDYVRIGADDTVEVDLKRIDRDQGAAIQEILVMPAREGGARAGRPATRVRLKLADKRAALNDLGRHFGLFVDRRQGPNAADEFADLSDEELAARIRDVAGQLRRLGIDVWSDAANGEADLGAGPAARPN